MMGAPPFVKRTPAMKLPLAMTLALLAASATAPLRAADAAAPSAKQLATLCAECRLVSAVKTEKRKGKATGVGIAGGAVAGGVIGSKVGDSTMATVGGAVVGGVLGNEAEKRIKRHTVWVVTSSARDGSTAKHEFEHDPQLKAGDVVVSDGKGLKRR
jgi:outer membrane lipoprotein SlyB